MKLKNHLWDLIRVKVLAYLGHKPQLFRDPGTVIAPGRVYEAYGYLIKAELLTDDDRAVIAELRQHPDSANITTPEGLSIPAPDPRCAICPLFIKGIPCRINTDDCEYFKYTIIKKPVYNNYG